ncbi:MAG: RNA pseudouridine synthase, partial [Deltaproteobacteria bacterium]
MGAEARSLVVGRDGVRLDRVVADALGCGRRAARRLLRDGLVRVDGRLVMRAVPVSKGACVEILPDRRPAPLAGPDRPRVLWRGKRFLAIDKPAGVHTVRGRSGG